MRLVGAIVIGVGLSGRHNGVGAACASTGYGEGYGIDGVLPVSCGSPVVNSDSNRAGVTGGGYVAVCATHYFPRVLIDGGETYGADLYLVSGLGFSAGIVHVEVIDAPFG